MTIGRAEAHSTDARPTWRREVPQIWSPSTPLLRYLDVRFGLLWCPQLGQAKGSLGSVLTIGGLPPEVWSLPARPEVEAHCAKFGYPKLAIRNSRGFNPHEE